MNAEQMPLVLTIPEAAELLRLKKSTAYKLVKEGHLPTIKIGRQVRIPRDELLKIIQGK